MASTATAAAAAAPQFYLDEKWKLSKKEGSRSRSSTSPLMRNSSQRRCSFTRKCASLVKEQRARFYIVRRCVTMLICWREYSDSWNSNNQTNRQTNTSWERERGCFRETSLFFRPLFLLFPSARSLVGLLQNPVPPFFCRPGKKRTERKSKSKRYILVQIYFLSYFLFA